MSAFCVGPLYSLIAGMPWIPCVKTQKSGFSSIEPPGGIGLPSPPFCLTQPQSSSYGFSLISGILEVWGLQGVETPDLETE